MSAALHHLSLLELRQHLGLSRHEFARRVRASIRSVIKWERGQCLPDASHQGHIANLIRAHKSVLPTIAIQPNTRTYNDAKMRYYEGKPGPAWLLWDGHKRASFYAHRARYSRIRAELESGRSHGMPVVDLLDSAPDLDLDIHRSRPRTLRTKSSR